MNAILVRVGADQSMEGGAWNGPVDEISGVFVYVAIPEPRPVHDGLERPYNLLSPALGKYGILLPPHLETRHMHLDPDFEHLTYGDRGERGKQIRRHLNVGDLVVFYAGLRPLARATPLVYALIGFLKVRELIRATQISREARHINAHSRRILDSAEEDLVVLGEPGVSGRLTRCLPIGEYRDGAYRVRQEILTEWGGLSVKDGYLQRSARLPRFLEPGRFVRWLDNQRPTLMQANN